MASCVHPPGFGFALLPRRTMPADRPVERNEMRGRRLLDSRRNSAGWKAGLKKLCVERVHVERRELLQRLRNSPDRGGPSPGLDGQRALSVAVTVSGSDADLRTHLREILGQELSRRPPSPPNFRPPLSEEYRAEPPRPQNQQHQNDQVPQFPSSPPQALRGERPPWFAGGPSDMEDDEEAVEAEEEEEDSFAAASSGPHMHRSSPPRQPPQQRRPPYLNHEPDPWVEGLDYDEYVEIMTAMEEALFAEILAERHLLEASEWDDQFGYPESGMEDEYESFIQSCRMDAIPCPACRQGYLEVDGADAVASASEPSVRCPCGQIDFRVRRHAGPFGPVILRGMLSAAVDAHAAQCRSNPRIFQPRPHADPPRLARLPPGLYLECGDCLCQKVILQ